MRKKKLLLLFILLCTCNLCSSNVFAATEYRSNITADSIPYIIYDTSLNSPISLCAVYRHNMEAVFNEVVIPPTSLHVTKTVSGITYSGNLYLLSHYHQNGKTYATYSGVLYPTV